jgi:SSS family solute:Na+ symporter
MLFFLMLLAMVFAPRYIASKSHHARIHGQTLCDSTKILQWYALIKILVTGFWAGLFSGGFSKTNFRNTMAIGDCVGLFQVFTFGQIESDRKVNVSNDIIN